jgi:hypothetical protein
MELKHTKGEWKVFWFNYTHAATINTDVKTRVCTIEAGRPDNAKEWEANVKLIAAAPDLLLACILAKVRLEGGTLEEIQFNKGIVNKLNEAINKATN